MSTYNIGDSIEQLAQQQNMSFVNLKEKQGKFRVKYDNRLEIRYFIKNPNIINYFLASKLVVALNTNFNS
jgi:hypothetical protein